MRFSYTSVDKLAKVINVTSKNIARALNKLLTKYGISRRLTPLVTCPCYSEVRKIGRMDLQVLILGENSYFFRIAWS